MSAPASAVDVCNLALDHLKQGVITDIENPSTPTEVTCARWYDATRRAVLRAHPWHFAKTRRVISRNAITPVFGFADAYDLPVNYLRFIFFGDDSISDYRQITTTYAIEGRQILLNNSGASSLNLGYIKDEISVTRFDSLFIELLALELALNMSYAFTLKNTVKTRIEDLAKRKRLEAKAINGQERPPIRIENSRFRQARRQLLSNVAGKNTIFRG